MEDEAFVREVICEVLRSAGYRVLTAKNAVEAMRTYEEHRWRTDLLLTDMVLPGETGRALAGRLRPRRSAIEGLVGERIFGTDVRIRGDASGVFGEAVFHRGAAAESKEIAGWSENHRRAGNGHACLR